MTITTLKMKLPIVKVRGMRQLENGASGAWKFVYSYVAVRCRRIRHISLALLLTHCCFAAVATTQSPFPFVYKDWNGKDGIIEVETIVPTCHSLEFLSQELPPIAEPKGGRELKEEDAVESHRLRRLTATSSGPVYELILDPFGSDIKIKMIVVAFEELYCPIHLHVYSEYNFPGPNDSFAVPRGKLTIMASEMVFSGTGRQMTAVYFLIDGDTIKRLHTKSGFKQAFSGLLPDGHGIWKGGGLDLRTLTYRKPVWRDSDANCCPSGGSVEIEFRIDDDQLVPIRSVYLPPESPSD